jgi:putative transcriptional regulator
MENQVKSLRKEKGMTQQEFAKMLGVSRQTIIAIENGRYHPSLELAFKIGRVMELPLEKIFFYAEEDNE